MNDSASARFARLLIRLDGESDRELAVGTGGSIGRGPENAFVISHPSVSRRHAEIRADAEGGFTVVDLGSLNGTSLNGQPVTGPRPLFHADELAIGEAGVLFLHEDGPTRSAAADAAWARQAAQLHGDVLDAIRAVVLFCDVRGCASLAQRLPAAALQAFLIEWGQAARDVLEAHGAQVDARERDALLVYWPIEDGAAPGPRVNQALRASVALWALGQAHRRRFAERFETGELDIMTGLHLGDVRAIRRDGTDGYSLEGVALEAVERLAEMKGDEPFAAVASWQVAQCAASELRFHNLGEVHPARDSEARLSALGLDPDTAS